MAMLSVFRVAQCGIRSLRLPLTRTTFMPKTITNTSFVSLRQMGHGPEKMIIRPGRFEWDQFKDELHFFFMLGLLPIGAVVLYSNLSIGPAELADIPEEYEPKNHEYYKDPIKRCFAKYVYHGPEKEHEKQIHILVHEKKQVDLNYRDEKVQELMKRRGDYKAWYYVPVDIGHYEQAKKDVDMQQFEAGTHS